MIPSSPQSSRRTSLFTRRNRPPLQLRRTFQPLVAVLENRSLLSTLTVTTRADNATQNHTLRYAVAHAQNGDTIQLTDCRKEPDCSDPGRTARGQKRHDRERPFDHADHQWQRPLAGV